MFQCARVFPLFRQCIQVYPYIQWRYWICIVAPAQLVTSLDWGGGEISLPQLQFKLPSLYSQWVHKCNANSLMSHPSRRWQLRRRQSLWFDASSGITLRLSEFICFSLSSCQPILRGWSRLKIRSVDETSSFVKFNSGCVQTRKTARIRRHIN